MSARRLHDRLWRALAGKDGAARAGLPFDEALAPLPLVALVLLVVNDRVLKATVPSWMTGKLSDVAGLAVAPLVLTAAVDTLAYGVARVAGVRLDWTLRRWKLVAAIGVTGAVFVAVKLWAPAAAGLAQGLAMVFGQARIVVDPTDLLTLPALGLAWWHGRRTLAQVPYGRVGWARAAAADAFVDAVKAGADAERIARLEMVVGAWREGGATAAEVDAVLRGVREG